MNIPKNVQISIALVLLIALTSMAYKAQLLLRNSDRFASESSYQVNYRYFFKTDNDRTFIRAFLPKNNSRQRITTQWLQPSSTLTFTRRAEGNNIRGEWLAKRPDAYESIDYGFLYEGKAKRFTVPDRFTFSNPGGTYLSATENIQVHAPEIARLANKLGQQETTDGGKIKALFDFVHAIPSAPIITLTDALTALRRNKASCNGKSRLLVALARHLGYPARMRGGIILKESNKRTTHTWAELWIDGSWVPFDALNGHFAYLPAHYLELYEGDLFLITHSPGIQFDYSYEIQKQLNIPFLPGTPTDTKRMLAASFWGLVQGKIISRKNLFLLLMLPLGGLIVALLRNVVGLRTFGVFLPVLIAFSLLETGYGMGLLLFLFLILFVGLIARPFNNMGLLHTPKLVISLTLMVLVMTVGAYIGETHNIPWLMSLTFFPTIILTISAERFSTLIVEDGFQKATGTLLQTLGAVSVCYALFSIQGLDTLLIWFPELLLVIIGASMVLGKYVGLRWTELIRFQPLLRSKTISI